MVTRVSAGVVINEFDFSEFAARVARATLAVVGGASKGRVGVPILFDGKPSLNQQVGYRRLDDYGIQTAEMFIQKGASGVYVRVTDGTETTADRNIPGTSGGTPAVAATGHISFTASTNPSDAEVITIGDGVTSKIFEFDDDDTITAGHIGVLIGATAAATLLNLMTAINNSVLTITAVDGTVTIPRTNLTNDVAGVAGNVTITTDGAAVAVAGMSGGAAAVPGSSTNVLKVFASSPGTWGNGMQVIIAATTDPTPVPGGFDLSVNAVVDEAGTMEVVERFHNMSLDSSNARYAEKVINQGIEGEVRASTYITVTVLSAGGTINAATYALGESGGTVGSNGISGLDAADYIGTVSGSTSTGLQALRNPEAVMFNLLAVPGVSMGTVISAMFTLSTTRADFSPLVDPPFGLDKTEVIEWHNGISGLPNAPVTVLNNSYAFLSWAWQQVYDSTNKVNVWLPPSGFVAANAALVQPWESVAGHLRGALKSDATEYSPTYDERDELMGGTNRVNPIVDFIGEGPTLFGNRTLLRRDSALSDWNFRRMLIFAEQSCASAVKFLVFEPNDPITWKKYEMLCNPILAGIARQRGMAQFRVICNADTNPPEQRAQRRMRAKMLIQENPLAEILQMDFAVFGAASEFTENF